MPFEIIGVDHVGYCIGNAKQAAVYYQERFGFSAHAYRGLETGCTDRTSHLLVQGKIRLLLETPMQADHPMNALLAKHGDAVRSIAFEVDDVRAAWGHTTERGAVSVRAPERIEDEHGSVLLASVETYGDTLHTFVQRDRYRGPFLPGFVSAAKSARRPAPVGLRYIDHMVGNQGAEEMEPVVSWYERVFGFHRIWTVDDRDVSTEFTSLRSVVVASGNERIKMPINEPARGLKKSQIQEYVEFNCGPGVQHLAFYTDDIVTTVAQLRANGVEFLDIPDQYYATLLDRVGPIDEDIDQLRESGILVDRDDRGYLLQLFTKPVQDRPTLFYEFIQRKGARSFGKGNFKALFESIEREQARRGTL
jgi:4-hydroxyphenylpyruvate dioxygenase